MGSEETALTGRIKKALKSRGAFFFKVHGTEFVMAGLPDLIVCYRGLFIGVEVKTPTGVVSPVQRYVHNRIREMGADGIAVVARSVGDVLAVLDGVDAHRDTIQRVTGRIRADMTKATPKGGPGQ